MKDQQKTFYRRKYASHLFYQKIFVIPSLLIILTVALAACGSSTSSNPPAGSTPAATPTAAKTPAANQYPIKVYFSKSPESENNFQIVYPVDRISPTTGVAAYAIQQLIAGPTATEKQAGYYSELSKTLKGSSSCSGSTGSDFTLILNKKGTTDEQGTATLKFCRTLASAGIGTDARILTEIKTTLQQFSTIKKVVVLTSGGHCFGDESGMDVCLK
jgi:hypothetical protein